MSTLKAIHLVDEGAYLVTAPHWGIEIEVDGMRVTGEFVVQDLSTVIEVERKQGAILYWEDAEGNTLLDLDRSNTYAELRGAATVDDDGELVFNNLDAEFAFRKFTKRWSTPVRAEPTVERKPVEFEITEVRTRSGDIDIVSLWNAPHLDADRRLYRLDCTAMLLREFNAQAARHGLTVEVPRHSGLRFAKIEDTYAFSDEWEPPRRPFIGTLEQCKSEKAVWLSKLTAIVNAHADKKNGAPLPNAGDVLLALRSVSQSLGKVRAKSGTEGSLSSARKHVSDLIDGLQTIVDRAAA